jgi:pimeloyl-ACP methyl ester carboxylesterase
LLQPLLVYGRTPLAFTVSSLVRVLRPLGTPALMAYAWLSPPGDRAVLNRPEIRAMFLDDMFKTDRLHAAVYDLGLFGREWGFSVSDVKIPVRWWHGDADHIIPFRHGQHMVKLLPDAELFVQSGESHLGCLPEAERILADLAETWDRVGASTG